MKTDTQEGYVRPKHHGVADLWWLGGRMSIKATAQETEGRFSQLVATDPRGTAAPLHTHDEATETFHIISGEVTFFLGDERLELGPGDFAFVPPGVRHTYLIRSEQAEFSATIVPAGTEGFFLENGTPVVPGEPQPAPAPPDPEEFARKARAYGIQIVGPPPALD